MLTPLLTNHRHGYYKGIGRGGSLYFSIQNSRNRAQLKSGGGLHLNVKDIGSFFFFFFFRFLYRRSSAILSWSSTHVLFWIIGPPYVRGSTQRPFSLVPLAGFEPMQRQSIQQVPTP